MLHTLVDGKTSRNVLTEKVDKQIMFDDELKSYVYWSRTLFHDFPVQKFN